MVKALFSGKHLFRVMEVVESPLAFLQSLKLFLSLYMPVATLVAIGFALIPGTDIQQRWQDIGIGLLLIFMICLHLIFLITQRSYSFFDAFLDAAILGICLFIFPFPIIANITYYLVIIVVACAFTTRRPYGMLLVMLASNQLATWGFFYTAPTWSNIPDERIIIALQFSLINLMGFPFAVFLAKALTRLVKLREDEMVIARQDYEQQQSVDKRWATTEKLASLGLVMSSLSHEMSNNLSVMTYALEGIMLQMDQHDQQKSETLLDGTEPLFGVNSVAPWTSLGTRALQQQVELIQNLRTQTRFLSGTVEEEFNVADVLDEIEPMLRKECERGPSELIVDIMDRDIVLFGDPGKLTQILINLVRNAVDAYTGSYNHQERPVWVTLRQQGDCSTLEVTDCGSGISSKNRAKIFDYLYTTKPSGKGLGVGLSLVYEIVSNHFGGQINVVSHEGEGTTIIIIFPKQRVSLTVRGGNYTIERGKNMF